MGQKTMRLKEFRRKMSKSARELAWFILEKPSSRKP